MKRTCLRLFVILTWVVFGTPLPSLSRAGQTRSVLTNEDIMRMTRLKFDDATITKTIQTSEANFDLSVNALVKLKEANVSQVVIQAMLSTNNSRKTSDKRSATPNGTWTVSDVTIELPQEVGVYVKQKGNLVTIDPEIVNWRTGGVLKQTATLGLDKGHLNGLVSGPHSKLALSWPPFGMSGSIEFYIRCVEGNSASEYQLLHFWEKGDRREFRAVTGGVLHASGGAKDNILVFNFEKVAPRIYKISLPNLGPGEYGFLAPGAEVSKDLASQGKIYTFRIAE